MTSMSARPFGSKSARFTQNGVHPNMLYRGRMPYDSLVTAPAVSLTLNFNLRILKSAKILSVLKKIYKIGITTGTGLVRFRAIRFIQ